MVSQAIKKMASPNPRGASFLENRSMIQISETHTEELVIALCGPIGSPLHEVSAAIQNKLTQTFGYAECQVIRLSELIEQHANRLGVQIAIKPKFQKINDQINCGNKLRELYGPSVLAELAVNTIRIDRETHKKNNELDHYPTRRACHIIDSIKNQEELNLLRMVYREMLYVVGVFVPLEQREENLKRDGLEFHEIYKLIDRDSGEETDNGQTVRKTFPNCDFFLRMDSGTDAQLKKRIERFLHLVLGTKIITPTESETAMYAASSAAVNSACLSRQVGAAVTDSGGNVISIGWNDVPRVDGGLYVFSPNDSDGEYDKRCWNKDGGQCFNDHEKQLFVSHLADILEKIIPSDKMDAAKDAMAKSSKISGLIEFSRAIHAEMHALLNAGNIAGEKIKGGRLYVTTYPCHSCARHIIAAGIKDVYYIEPYRKSLAIRLHGDAISERESDTTKVRILSYDGVAPIRYVSLFKSPLDSRKKSGKLISPATQCAKPRHEISLEALPTLEAIVVQSLVARKVVGDTGGQNDEDGPDAA
jgi:deoxycytidylate deaminase